MIRQELKNQDNSHYERSKEKIGKKGQFAKRTSAQSNRNRRDILFSDEPDKTKEWYAQNLGLKVDQWGSSFEFRNAHRPDEINYLQWSPFPDGSKYFAPSKKEFMINYRVQNIVGLVEKLKANGVQILDEIETFEYGKFVHIMDEEGRKIELWEPIDSVFTEMGVEPTK